MLVSTPMTFHSKYIQNIVLEFEKRSMDSSTIIFCTSVVWFMTTTAADGQINRYINPAWLEMDANSEFYPGGEVISRILRAYGLLSSDGGGGGGGVGLGWSVNGPSVQASLDRNGASGRFYSSSADYPRNRLNYDSDPSAQQEYADRSYDYADNTIRSSNRYRNTLMDVPIRRNRINVADVPRTSYYYQSDNDVDRDPLLYSRSRYVAGDPSSLLSRSRETAGRIIPRSTVAPVSAQQPKNT